MPGLDGVTRLEAFSAGCLAVGASVVCIVREERWMAVVENRYLVGNYAPVADEVTCGDLRVSGSLPEAFEAAPGQGARCAR